MRPVVAHCHLGLGMLYRRRQDHSKGQQHMMTARAMYQEMGMAYWAEKAWAEMSGAPSSVATPDRKHGHA